MSSDDAARIRHAIASARADIALIQKWAAGRGLNELRADKLVRYAIERAFIAVDASIRDIPSEHTAAHAIPARAIAGFRNALAHTYDDILDERVILTIKEDLPALDAALDAIAAQFDTDS